MNYNSPLNLSRPEHLITDTTSFNEFIQIINERTLEILAISGGINNPEAIFRGETQVFKNPCMPKIYRDFSSFVSEKSEIKVYALENIDLSNNRLHFFSKMQHDGKPTRLLDWSLCPKIALFFSCYNPDDRDKDGVIHLFVPNLSINSLSPLESFSLEHIDLYLDAIGCGFDEDALIAFWEGKLSQTFRGIIIPWCFPIGEEQLHHASNKKRTAQRGAHTFHPGYLTITPLGDIIYRLIPGQLNEKYSTKEARENAITSIIIPSRQKPNILKKLDECCHINAKTLHLET